MSTAAASMSWIRVHLSVAGWKEAAVPIKVTVCLSFSSNRFWVKSFGAAIVATTSDDRATEKDDGKGRRKRTTEKWGVTRDGLVCDGGFQSEVVVRLSVNRRSTGYTGRIIFLQ
jgi:hypothetical protein